MNVVKGPSVLRIPDGRPMPAGAGCLAGPDLTSLGFGGQCHLDQHVARTKRDLDADLVSLELGIKVVNGGTHADREPRLPERPGSE